MSIGGGTTRFALGALAALALLAGCGGDGGGGAGDGSQTTEGTVEASTPAGGGSKSKAAFIKEADAICAEAQTKVNAGLHGYLDHGTSQPRPPEEGAEDFVAEVVIPTVEEEVERITALGPPADAEQASGALVVAFEEVIDEAESDPQGFFADAKAAQKATKTLQALGFKSCGPV